MDSLVELAQRVRSNAYAPYSGYKVGASILDSDGKMWSGVNVENISFGGTICAERSALVQMVTGGGTRIERLCVATKDGASPCGICLQALLEFSAEPEKTSVTLVDETGRCLTRSLHEFLPYGFRSGQVERT